MLNPQQMLSPQRTFISRDLGSSKGHRETSLHFHLPFPFSSAGRPAVSHPEVDVRETPADFWVDVSLPGVADPKEVKVEWLDSRELSISGHIEKPDTSFSGEEKSLQSLERQYSPAAPIPVPERKAAEEPSSKAQTKEDAQSELAETNVRFLVEERTLGLYNRSLTFPVDVDHDAVRANLKSGLLRIKVPKVVHNEKVPHRRVLIN
jgi:HSP20 family molecular chaperone IbpA